MKKLLLLLTFSNILAQGTLNETIVFDSLQLHNNKNASIEQIRAMPFQTQTRTPMIRVVN